jgi:hypothetical protein
MTSTFACESTNPPYAGCAGVNPVIAGPTAPDVDPTDPQHAGGDDFDLAPEGDFADRVEITDAGHGEATPPTAGFDLDAIAVVHALPRDATRLTTDLAHLELSRGQSTLLPRFDATTAAGETIAGVPVQTSMSRSGLLSFDGEVIHALEAGTATLTAHAGPLAACITIEVRP